MSAPRRSTKRAAGAKRAATPPLLVSRVEAARLLGTSVSMVDRLRRTGELRTAFVNRRALVPRESVVAFAARAAELGDERRAALPAAELARIRRRPGRHEERKGFAIGVLDGHASSAARPEPPR